MDWLTVLLILALLVAGIVLAVRTPMFRVVPYEQTEWGMLFAVIDGWGRRHFVGRFKEAHEQCVALNSPQSTAGQRTGR